MSDYTRPRERENEWSAPKDKPPYKAAVHSIQYTDLWFSGSLWYVNADGYAGAGRTQAEAYADARRELAKVRHKEALRQRARSARETASEP